MKLYAPNSIDWLAILSGACIVIGLLLILGGCAMTGEARTDQTRNQHEVTVEKSQIPLVGADGVVQLVLVTKTTERWLDEGTKTVTNETKKTIPDIPAIAAVAGPAVSAATGISLTQGAGALGTLALTTVLGWMARRGEVKNKDQQLEERDQRLERLRIDRDETRARAEQYARQLPPDAGDDRS